MIHLLLALVLAQATPSASPLPAPSASVTPSAEPTPSAAPTPNRPLFVAPKTWRRLGTSSDASTGPYKVLGQWVHYTTRSMSLFNVYAGPNIGLSIKDYAELNLREVAKSMPNVRFLQNHAVALCNGTPGWIVRYQRPMRGGSMALTQVFAVTATKSYIATYAHTINQPDERDGIAALNSLCPAPETAVESGPAPITAPQGWMHASVAGSDQSTGPALWAWYGPPRNGSTPAVVVMTFPTAQSASASFDEFLPGFESGWAKTSGTTLQLIDQKPVTLCRADGVYARFNATGKDKHLEVDAVFSLGAPISYAAIYARGFGDPSLDEAQKSIMSLCPTDRQSAG